MPKYAGTSSQPKGKCDMELKKLISDGEKVQVFECDGKCVKLFKDHNEPKSVVLYEAITHARVEETGYGKIPAFEEIVNIDGKYAIVYQLAEGRTLELMLRENPNKCDALLGQMADIQLEINALSSAKVSRLKDYLNRSIDGLDMIDDVKKYELLTLLNKMPVQTKLCHGDFSPDNIIIGDKRTFVVDWLKAKQGNPAADAAKTYLGFCLSHHTEWAEKYLKLYCAKSGMDMGEIRGWLPIVAAAQLKFKRPEEREVLLTFIDMVDYRD